jgi:hypothetical protein
MWAVNGCDLFIVTGACAVARMLTAGLGLCVQVVAALVYHPCGVSLFAKCKVVRGKCMIVCVCLEIVVSMHHWLVVVVVVGCLHAQRFRGPCYQAWFWTCTMIVCQGLGSSLLDPAAESAAKQPSAAVF